MIALKHLNCNNFTSTISLQNKCRSVSSSLAKRAIAIFCMMMILRLIIEYDDDDDDSDDYMSVAPQWHLSRDKCSAFMLLLTH